MAPHLIWAGVVLVLGVLAVRLVSARLRLTRMTADAMDAIGRGKFEHDQLRNRVHALESEVAENKKEATQLGQKVGELDIIIKQLTVAAKAAPQRRV